MTETYPRLAKMAVIIALCGLCSFAVFSNAVKYEMPLGYAGMYASMSQELANANFILPQTASFYGPGGIPFAYPPLGFYLMALFIKIGLPALVYLRFAPSVIGLLSLLAFFGLSKSLFSSTPAAMLACLLAATSPYLYESHIWAAGIVRGLAFGLFSLAFWAFLRVEPGKIFSKQAFLVGILAGLVALTHLAYIFFLCLWIGVWIISQPAKKLYFSIPGMLAGGLITILPWLSILIQRYGVNIFFQAINAHSTLSFVQLLTDPWPVMQLLQTGLSELLNTPLLAGMAIAGIIQQLVKKQIQLPVLFAICAFFNIESRRFIVLLGIFLAVHFLLSLYNTTANKKNLRLALAALIGTLSFVLVFNGYHQIQQTSPSMTASLLDISTYLSTQTQAKSQYLLIADYNEAEWLPYLAQRTPIIAPWGGEWLGNLDMQTTLFYQTIACAQGSDLACLKESIVKSGRTPDYYIVMKRKYRPLLNTLEHTKGWKRLYNSIEYQIWQNTAAASGN